MSSAKPKSNVLTLVIVTLLCFLGMIYGVTYVTTGNLFWFLSNAEVSEPMRIVISVEGERVAFVPGDQEYEELAPIITEAVTNFANNDLVPIGLSEQTLEDYRSSGVNLEVHYPRPIKFNTPFRIGEPSNLLIPITGRHSGGGNFFLGEKGEWWYGGMRMADPEPLYQQLEAMGFTSALMSTTSSGS